MPQYASNPRDLKDEHEATVNVGVPLSNHQLTENSFAPWSQNAQQEIVAEEITKETRVERQPIITANM
jgi:hypothetical protein